jgi:hypothetical protein
MESNRIKYSEVPLRGVKVKYSLTAGRYYEEVIGRSDIIGTYRIGGDDYAQAASELCV